MITSCNGRNLDARPLLGRLRILVILLALVATWCLGLSRAEAANDAPRPRPRWLTSTQYRHLQGLAADLKAGRYERVLGELTRGEHAALTAHAEQVARDTDNHKGGGFLFDLDAGKVRYVDPY